MQKGKLAVVLIHLSVEPVISAKTIGQFLAVEAKSMYFGGERIALDDVRLDKFSCDKLGLVCTVCKEPVRRRKGEINIPHFAHFPKISTQTIEECERRRSVHSNGNFPPLDWFSYEGERLELFQKHFLSIIKKSIPDLDVNAIDSKKKTDTIYGSIQLQSINLLKRERRDFARHIRQVSERTTELEIKIACEALCYITVASSEAIFMLISEHLILHARNFSYAVYDSRFPKELCFKVSNLLASVDWTESFASLSGVRPPQAQEHKQVKKTKVDVSIVHFSRELSERLEEDSNMLLYLVKEKMFLGMSDSLSNKERELIGFVKTNELLLHGRGGAEKTEEIRCTSSSIRIFKRHYRFSLFKDAIESDFLPLLRKAIRNKPKSNGSAISVKSRFGKLRLSKGVEDFLMDGKAQIISCHDVIALVTIDTLSENKYADEYLIKNFFVHSDKYRLTQRKYPMLQTAVVRLIQRQYKKLHSQ